MANIYDVLNVNTEKLPLRHRALVTIFQLGGFEDYSTTKEIVTKIYGWLYGDRLFSKMGAVGRCLATKRIRSGEVERQNSPVRWKLNPNGSAYRKLRYIYKKYYGIDIDSVLHMRLYRPA